MNRDHPDLRKQNGQWQNQQSSYHQQQSSQPQRSLHPSQNRTASPQPTSPTSPNMHINTNAKPGGGGGPGSQQRSNPSSPSGGSAGNAMEIAARHYEALQKYLLAHILKEKHGVSEQRIAAREKLSRLLQNQLQDLSTDVYDELKRRTDEVLVPFLAVRDDFHPKRNQARQKLATLPQNRFKDLASDVYVQLERQFPTLLEMFPLKALEEKEYLLQQSQQERESNAPAVQQSSVVPNVATFTIQDSSNVEEDDSYYRSPRQQSPSTPMALEGSVNFASLDSLMADIGHIVSKDGSDASKSSNANANKGAKDTSKGLDSKGSLSAGVNAGSLPSDATQLEYETRIVALCKRLQHLESELGDAADRPEGSRLAQVERQLSQQTELYNEQTSKLSKLQLDYNKVLGDYHAQLETVDMINQEVKSLVMETKGLKQKNMDAEEELQLAYDKIKQLEDENNDLKATIEDLQRNPKKSTQEDVNYASTSVSNNPASNSNNSRDNNAARPDHKAENDSNNKDWNHDRQQARLSVMINTSSVVHKDSLDSFRNAIDDLLIAARSDSSSSVLLGMKSVVIACKNVTEDVDDYEHEMGPDQSFTELKQELSAGLTQLMTAAKAHSNAFNEGEEEFDRSLGELEAAADQLEAIVMDIVSVPKRVGDQQENGMNRDVYDEKQDNSNRAGVNDKHPGGSTNKNIDNEEGPMDALDLKIYLETQTASIVSSIQTLLTSLRSNSSPDDICEASDTITKVVDQVVRQTRMTLATPDAMSAPQAQDLQSQGEMVLEDLENSLDLLIEMKEQIEQEPELAQSASTEAKSIKQKMASASFDIAKYTKELVSLIEE
ncbi:component of the polarisome [Lobosporangium transversale]|uniref:GIT Spa2 homology (SHD) domain-containing protein n=1 Tax=Lobosporangium transversale TaxID=64571 RepID=A0A1Y2GAE2_9FUNG|nr:hypothetical protein BCR41DRAFT_361713 [Lobosporangium transversale]KAF9912665.1 component of the polarisome [Lobosporangium transversale]ORZ05513.1 hypothetical protein BCR41DRAFT_361713 [Lobosporangium transversale]|eukprot:XP_021877087.1 hypothetical protein BCR41DRAFT_361713 [Lobosporangium transversale]